MINIKRWQPFFQLPKWLFLLGLLLMTVQAQEAALLDARTAENDFNRPLAIRTHTIQPIMLSFFKSDDPQEIQGQVSFLAVQKADRLLLEAFDGGGAKFYEQSLAVDLEQKKSQTFRFRAPSYGLSAGSRMTVQLFNQDSMVGREEKTLPKIESSIKHRISQVESRVGEKTIEVELFFENGSLEPVSVQPQIKVWQQSIKPEGLVVRDVFEVSEVAGKERKKLSYRLALPREAGVYRVEVVALDSNKKTLSGTLESFFVIPGDFAVFDGAYLEGGTAGGQTQLLRFAGDYEGQEEVLELRVTMTLFDLQGRLVERLVESANTYVSRGTFSQRFRLQGPSEELSRVEIYGQLFNAQGEDLAEMTEVITLNESVVPGEVLVEENEVVDDSDGFAGWQWQHWAGLALALLLLFLLVLWLWRSHRRPVRTFMYLIVALVGWQSTAQAALEVFWHHPVANWHFNHTAAGEFADFGLMKVQGNIFDTLTQKGFFYKVPERIVVSFFKDLSYTFEGVRQCTECFYMEADMSSAVEGADCVAEDAYVGPAAEICDNKTYRFELDLPAVLEEGQWGVQVLFKMDGVWYATNWVDDGTGAWHRIYFDETAPNLPGDITYDGAEAPLNGDLAIEARDPLTTGPTGIVQLNQNLSAEQQQLLQKKLRREALKKIANNKIKDRNHLVAVEIYNREQAIANGAVDDQGNSLAPQLETEIQQRINLANGLVENPAYNPANPLAMPDSQKGINDLAFEIGALPPAHLVIAPDVVLQTPSYISALTAVDLNHDAPNGGSNLDQDVTTHQGNVNTIETSIQGVEAQLRSIGQVHTLDPIDVGLGCLDPEIEAGVDGSGCLDTVLTAPVRGNFCEYGEVCQTDAVRTYKICDQIGNCSGEITNESRMDWYDPVAPNADDLDVVLYQGDIGGTETVITGGAGDKNFVAAESVAIEITADDPNATYLTHPALFDTDACGTQPGSDFFKEQATDTFCTQARVRCPLSSSKRGMKDWASGGTCVGDCPPGYALQGDLCVPFCDFRLFNGCFPFLLIGDQCEVTTWIPDESTVPFGDPFTQVNNCGQSRQAVGTRSVTGSVKHFLDGIETFGAFLYDGEDDDGVTYIINAELENGAASGYDGFTPVVSALDFADFATQPGNAPTGGHVFRFLTLDVDIPEGYAAWRQQNIAVTPNTDYVISYWVKTDMTVNTNEFGVWPRVTGNGASPNLYEQYSSTMEGIPGDLQWYKVIVEFTTPADTTEIELQMRGQGQINKEVFFDDIKLFEADWRFALDKSWLTEPMDDTDGTCEYITGSGNSVEDGPDDRCGFPRFPEKTIVIAARDGMYLFDVEKGTFWLKATQVDNPSVKGAMIWNPLFDGQMYGFNGSIYGGFRFEDASGQHDGRQGALLVADFINDTIFAHQVDDSHLLSGFKRDGSSAPNDNIAQRNVERSKWEDSMPINEQIASQKINDISANSVSGTTYVAAATDYGISLINRTANTVQHLEYSGFDADNYNWKDLPSNFNRYHQARLMDDGKLWYQWDLDEPAGGLSRIWILNNYPGLPFNSAILSGNNVYTSQIEPAGTSGAYPTTNLSGTAQAFDVRNDGFVISGGDEGFEIYRGTLSAGNAHPGLSRQWVSKNAIGAPLYGEALGHWSTSVTDLTGMGNNLTNAGGVTFSEVATDTELTAFDLNGSNQYLTSGSSDFQQNGPITFGAWVKTTGAEDGGYIISKGSDSAHDFALYRKSDNTLRVEGAAVTDIPGYTLGDTSNDWDFVAVTFDGTHKKTYLNNQLISTVADTTTDFTGGGGAGINGRYVRIEQNTQNVRMNVAEVQVFEASNPTNNLALTGTATQIDTQQTHVASRAIDGNTDGNMLNESVAETKKGDNRWWEVDLGPEKGIGDIRIWNRTDCCNSSIKGAVVQILSASRALVAESLSLSGGTVQTASFPTAGSGVLMIGSSPLDDTLSTNLLNGQVALPFMSAGAYTSSMLTDIYDQTSPWFADDAKVFLQGVSNEVIDVALGDDGDYFVATSEGITHFGADGLVIRTLTDAVSDSFNTQIVSNYINEIDYKDRYLLVSYADPDDDGPLPARGLEVINIGSEPND